MIIVGNKIINQNLKDFKKKYLEDEKDNIPETKNE